MNRIYFISLALFLSMNSVPALAQDNNFVGWFGTFATVKINGKIAFTSDAQFRSTAQLKQWTTIMVRPGITYKISEKFIGAVGYAFVNGRKKENGISALIPEQRLWQHIQFEHDLGRSTLLHRLRFEERFLKKPVLQGDKLVSGENQTAYRLRYYFRSQVPFSGDKDFEKGPYFAYQNEVFFNFGDKSAVNGKVFDQNRAFVALGLRLKKQADIEAGYLYQRVAEKQSNTNNHILQVATYLRF